MAQSPLSHQFGVSPYKPEFQANPNDFFTNTKLHHICRKKFCFQTSIDEEKRHLKKAVAHCSLSIPIEKSRLCLLAKLTVAYFGLNPKHFKLVSNALVRA